MLAIVNKESNSICGTIGASIQRVTVFDKTEKFGVVNFLCAHPIYRKKKIAFTLIDEAVRRIVKYGVNRGCFTTERCVPTPTTVIRYYHRPINYLKLQKYGFCDAGGNPEIVQKKFEVKNEFPSDCSEMTNIHIKECYKLYKLFMSRFNIYCEYTEKEFGNTLVNNKFVKSYVVIDNEKVVDFMSYYILPYAVENVDEKINSAYLFLHSCNKMNGNDMVEKLFQILKMNEMDLLNVTDTMLMTDVLLTKELKNTQNSDAEDADKVFEHKFLKGSGKLYFNFFNWKCPEIKPKQLSWFSF
jgi:glycylpeptide N-tetradecanoyltransferase